MDNKQLLVKVAINKSLLKEYSTSENKRVVYMKNNSEFQIQLFNPYSYIIGAEIFINGTSLQNKIVLKPGERIWLERYFDSANKFLFSTYEVNGNNEQVKRAIQNNGEIKIQFYKEYIAPVIHNTGITYVNYNNPLWYDYSTCYNNDNCKFTADLALDNNLVAKGLNTTKLYCSTTGSDVNSAATARCMTKLSADTEVLSKKIETGRVEKGSHSNQTFNTMNITFEYFAFSTEIIKILPESQKPIYKTDLVKQYCSNCGRKLNQKFKFCPYCGAKVEYCPNNQNKNYILEKCPNCGRTVRSNMMECPHCGEILR